ncbi:amino acid deaminase [Lacisediminihabitans sp.]|uniref:amino acid deaminase n=1 Tax=Lacisediminihabitans sp. TaxID=2787631 RepID=UPI00374CE975
MAVSTLDKSFPPASWGLAETDLAAAGLPLHRFQTPVLTLDSSAMASNVEAMARWTRDAGVALAPHGKTTMAPDLWRRQLDAGAWGITLATAWQVQVARSFGVERVMLANVLVDPVGLRWVAAELAAHPEFSFICWADSVESIERMVAELGDARPDRPVRVIVELGAEGGRTGARTVGEALEVARAVDASPALALAGCGGYEGALAHDRSAEAVSRDVGYLDDVARLHLELEASGLYRHGEAIVTVGGSAYFDLVVDRLGGLASSPTGPGVDTTVVLRSGAYLVHDDGFYRGITPSGAGSDRGPVFRSAMHAWVRVVSRPEPGLVIFDGGRRDLPFDEGMPQAQRVSGADVDAGESILRGSRVTALNDQHGFLRLRDDAPADALPVGSVLRLGLSHPCTALDKWRLIPLIDDADAALPTVVGAVRTYF